MLVVTTISLSEGFKAWKEMVHASEDKLKEYGIFYLQAPRLTTIVNYIRLSTLNPKLIYNAFIRMKSLQSEELRRER